MATRLLLFLACALIAHAQTLTCNAPSADLVVAAGETSSFSGTTCNVQSVVVDGTLLVDGTLDLTTQSFTVNVGGVVNVISSSGAVTWTSRTCSSCGGSGGGHAGPGGAGTSSTSSTYRVQTGDPLAPTNVGPPGSLTGGKAGGLGGGAFKLNTQSLANRGSILSNGANGASSSSSVCCTRTLSSGGGAGGSLWITTVDIDGPGLYSANGGTSPSATYRGGGGSGGRIALVVTGSVGSSFVENLQAQSGIGVNSGAAGSMYIDIVPLGLRKLVFAAGLSGSSRAAETNVLTNHDDPSNSPPYSLSIPTFVVDSGASVLLRALDTLTVGTSLGGAPNGLLSVDGILSTVAAGPTLPFSLTLSATGSWETTPALTIQGGQVSIQGTVKGMDSSIDVLTTTTQVVASLALHPSPLGNTTYTLSGSVFVQNSASLSLVDTSMVVGGNATVGSGCVVTVSQTALTEPQWWNITGSLTMGDFVASNPTTTFNVNYLRMHVGGTVTFDENVVVNGNGLGWTDSTGPGAGGTCSTNCGGDGAGHAGSSATGLQYGSLFQPALPGSAGGKTNNAAGGSGGGAFALFSFKLVLLGTIQMNGNNGGQVSAEQCCSRTKTSGGGSAGSIWIVTDSITLTACSFAANGGSTTSSTYRGGGGSGGRVAIYAKALVGTYSPTFSAIGGDGSPDGAAGTIYIDIKGFLQQLLIDGGGRNGGSPVSGVTILTANENPATPNMPSNIVVDEFQPVRGANILIQESDSLTVVSNVVGSMPSLVTVAGRLISPRPVTSILRFSCTVESTGLLQWGDDLTSLGSLLTLEAGGVIVGMNGTMSLQPLSTYNSIVSLSSSSVHTPWSLSGSLTLQDSCSLTFSNYDVSIAQSVLMLDDTSLTFNSPTDDLAVVTVGTDMTVGASLQLATVYSGALNLTVSGTLYVRTLGAINGDARGYAGGTGPGAGAPCTGDCGPGGAGHAGVGVTRNAAGGLQYGTFYTPSRAGSGGGLMSNSYAGSGGGALVITCDILNNLGTISVDGGPGVQTSASACCSRTRSGGGGAGGSIFVRTRLLMGTGAYTAMGGSVPSATYRGGPGSGGRIAMYSQLLDSNFDWNINVQPISSGAVAGAGSVYRRVQNGTVLAFERLTFQGAGTDTVANYPSTLTIYDFPQNEAPWTAILNEVELMDGAWVVQRQYDHLVVVQPFIARPPCRMDIAGTLTASSSVEWAFHSTVAATATINWGTDLHLFGAVLDLGGEVMGLARDLILKQYHAASSYNPTMSLQATASFGGGGANSFALTGDVSLGLAATLNVNLPFVSQTDGSLPDASTLTVGGNITMLSTATINVDMVQVSVQGEFSIPLGALVEGTGAGLPSNLVPAPLGMGDSTSGDKGAGGGGYGGAGGGGYTAQVGGVVYGDEQRPAHPGSPGGTGRASPGVGGGYVHISATRLSVSGIIRMDGDDSSQTSASACCSRTVSGGAGSGGGMLLDTHTFSGSGELHCDGGSAPSATYRGGGGGGGRIAVYSVVSTFTGIMSAVPGNGYAPGVAGTIYVASQPGFCGSGCGHGYCSSATGTAQCVCFEGWTGTICSTPVCAFGCSTNGVCVGVDDCRCNAGFVGAACNVSLSCTGDCSSNGICVGPEICACYTGFVGVQCETALCPIGCGNGVCSGPSTCACDAGWTGSGCDTLMCTASCQNGGNCYNGVCQCPSGFAGTDCSIITCSGGCHAGNCVAGDTCECLPGYTGAACDITMCSSNCTGQGQCVGPEVCHCDIGYVGSDCSLSSNHSACNAACVHGICASGTCYCESGFSGDDCSQTVGTSNGTDTSCAGGCGANGQCFQGSCYCSNGYLGANCETSTAVSGCTAGCVNGVCVGSTCYCTNGFEGVSCSTPVVDTTGCSGGCGTNGACVNSVCYCSSGYQGAACETQVVVDVTGCAGGCGANGLCVNSTCFCSSGYQGDACDVPVVDTTGCVGGCGANGFCVNSTCFCSSGYQGDACDVPVVDTTGCAGGCGANGFCANSTCFCSDGFSGISCQTAPPVNDTSCSPDCGSGICQAGKCYCLSSAKDGCSSTDPSYSLAAATPAATPTVDVSSGSCSIDCASYNATCFAGLCYVSVATCDQRVNDTASSCAASTSASPSATPLASTCASECVNGTCVSGMCHCVSGWTGATCNVTVSAVCDQRVDEAVSQCSANAASPTATTVPCSTDCASLNSTCIAGLCYQTVTVCNTTCQDRIDEAVDEAVNMCPSSGCPQNFTGAACDVPVCTLPCANGGSCVAPDTCSCASGWTGSDCAVPVCSPSCGAFGNCTAPNTCECDCDHTGAQCDTLINVCFPECLNGAVCLVDTCYCEDGWHGADCGTAVNGTACNPNVAGSNSGGGTSGIIGFVIAAIFGILCLILLLLLLLTRRRRKRQTDESGRVNDGSSSRQSFALRPLTDSRLSIGSVDAPPSSAYGSLPGTRSHQSSLYEPAAASSTLNSNSYQSHREMAETSNVYQTVDEAIISNPAYETAAPVLPPSRPQRPPRNPSQYSSSTSQSYA